MEFCFLKDEVKDFVELVNKSFNMNADYNNFKLDDNQRVLLLKDNSIIVGGALITVKSDPIKNIKSFYLDYICISEDYRNMGLGSKLFKEIERIAKEEKIDNIQLTSSKKREYARKMYLKENMEIKDTDLFIKYVR